MISKPIYSTIINLLYWISRLNQIREIMSLLHVLKEYELTTLMSKFQWTEDTMRDWSSWVITTINRDFKGDCEDAAILAKWWYKKHNISSRIVYLTQKKDELSLHAICVRKDNTEFISNNYVISLNSSKWKEELLYFFPEYKLSW